MHVRICMHARYNALFYYSVFYCICCARDLRIDSILPDLSATYITIGDKVICNRSYWTFDGVSTTTRKGV